MLGVALAATGLSLILPTFNKTADESGTLLVHAERVIVKPGVELANRDVLVQDGVIVAVGEGLVAPEGAREISGKVVCAGFVDSWSALGLTGTALGDANTSASYPPPGPTTIPED